jgi:hypothetical protein
VAAFVELVVMDELGMRETKHPRQETRMLQGLKPASFYRAFGTAEAVPS